MTNEQALLEVVRCARRAVMELNGLEGALVVLGRPEVARAVNRDISAPMATALANLDRLNP